MGEETESVREDIPADSLGRGESESVCIGGCVCNNFSQTHICNTPQYVCVRKGKHNNSPCRLSPGEEPVGKVREKRKQV